MKNTRTVMGKSIMTSVVSIYVMISLIGCTVAWDALPNGSFEIDDIIDPVASVVEEQYQTIEPILIEHDEAFRTLSRVRQTPRDGRQIVSNMLEEDRGEEYLQFAYTLLTSEDSQEVVVQAEYLVPPDEYQELLAEVDRATRQIESLRTELSRSVPPSQQAAFMKDMQKLLTKSIVLLVAGVVYAAIPTVIFWGKVTAAAAVSVAAGVLATTFMALYRYYTLDDQSMAQSFQEWIVDVTTDSTAAYTLATSMITVGKSMGYNAVVTGLILVVFSIYNVIDMVKPMLAKYNFGA
ncbi:MAG: hypothetical protein JXK93_13445 [Sphaerochaetaceae bacterium]|nr:hypothetical protein [Sphaerochaetaceae bacterium]